MATLIQDREPTQKRILKKVTPYSVGSTSFDQGDSCFSITAFDDYVYFALTEEREGEEVFLDLTGYGNIYLRFKNKDLDISIKSVEQIDNIDPSKGECVFKVDRENSLQIIASGLNSFAIVSRLDIGDDKSFENIIFQGKFSTPDENIPATSRFEALYNEEIDTQIQELEASVAVLRQDNKQAEAQNSIIQNDIDSLSVKFTELDKKYKAVLKNLGKQEKADEITTNPTRTLSARRIDAVQRKIEELKRPLPTQSPPVDEEETNVQPRPTYTTIGGKPQAVTGGGAGFNDGGQGSAGDETIPQGKQGSLQ